MDQKVEFRVGKGKAYLPGAKKEASYHVVGMGKTDPKPRGTRRKLIETV